MTILNHYKVTIIYTVNRIVNTFTTYVTCSSDDVAHLKAAIELEADKGYLARQLSKKVELLGTVEIKDTEF